MAGSTANPPPGAGHELERARSVQLTMLPEAPTVDTLEIACSFRACDMLGGDFYDFILVDPWRLGIVIADVSGHGMAAALLAAAAKKVLQMCGRGNLSPRRTLLEVNDSIRADIPSGMFLSCLYGVLDIRNHRLCFASCGHNPPVLKRGDRVNDAWTHGNAPVLGVLPSDQLDKFLHEEFVQLEQGDRMLFYTDGLTEAFNNAEAMYGEKRLHNRVRDSQDGPAQALLDALRADVDAFRDGAILTDDETMVALKVDKPSEHAKPLIAGAAGTESHLPTFASPLIGRDDDVASVVKHLQQDRRVVTITGPAGAGKSRVAVSAAEACADSLPGGVHYVDLRQARTTDDLYRQVATALNLGDDETRLALRIGMALKGQPGRSLLVLDNCDRAHEAVKGRIADWTSGAPELRILATSRAPIGAAGESCHQLRPLAYPKPGADNVTADAYPAVALFVQRARDADQTFRLTDQNRADVVRICARLDGLPQALELAAARVSVLSPRQIMDRLDKMGGEGNTLDGTLAMSWDVLSDTEQAALMLLSQYPNGFQLDSATALLGNIRGTLREPQGAVRFSNGAAPEDLVGSLLKQSLLHYEVMDDLDGDRRFFMYESVRAFAKAKLKASELVDAARRKFESAVLDYVLHWWRQDLASGDPVARRRVLHELEALLDISAGTRTPEARAWAAVVTAPILYAQGEQDRAMQMLRSATTGLLPGSDEWMWIQVTDANLRVNDAPEHVAEMLEKVHGDTQVCFSAALTRATALNALGRTDAAATVIKEAAALEGLSAGQQARLKDRLGVIYGEIGRLADARRLIEAAIKQARDYGAASLVGRACYNLGWISLRAKKPAEAVKYLQQALEIVEQEGDRGFEASLLSALALALHQTDKKQESEACALRGMRLSRELGRTFTEVTQLNTLTRIYHEQGRYEEAVRLAKRARKLAREIGARKSEAVAESNVAALDMLLGNNIPEAEAAWRRSFSILMELGETRSALSTLANMGVMLGERWKAKHNHRDLNSAIEALAETVRRRREMNSAPQLDAEVLLAQLMIDTGRGNEARELLAECVETARRHRAPEPKVADAERLLNTLGPAAPTRRRGRGSPKRPGMPTPAPRTSDSSTIAPPPPKKKVSSESMPVVKPPPPRNTTDPPPAKRPRSSGVMPPVKKPTSGSMPPLKPRRPKGKPGAAPRRRRHGFN